MKFIQPFLLLSFLFTLSLWSATPVPYSGKIDIRGVNYFGEAQFAFSLHDGNGTTHWRNGNQPKETIKVTIRNGRYNVLLGGQGMNSLPPELFLKHDKLYLKVEVDMGDEEGLRHLAPDQLITATPRALVADLAKVAQKVGNGAITRDMLSSEVLAQLDANVTVSPSAPVTITRDMLPKDVRDDLNKTVTITRNMLPADVLADLNKSSTTATPITLSMLAPEVTAKLDQNTAAEGNASTLVAFRLRKENDQTGITDGNYSKVTWESSSFDRTNNFDLAQDAFIVPENGIYAISSSARFSFIEAGVFANLIIKRNNQSINSGITIRAGGNSGVYISSVSAIVDANKSDTISIVAMAGQSGSSLPVSIISDRSTYFEGFKISGSSSSSIQPNSISKSMLGSDILSELNATIGMNRLSSEIRAKIDQNTTIADGSVTASKLANNTITTSQLNEQILKYLKPEITAQPQAQTVYGDSNVSFSVTAEGKYLTYQWKKDGVDLTGETNATLNITDANATLHDGNYSVVVSNDFGSVESGEILVDVNTTWSTDGLVGWWKFDETNGTVAYDSSGNGNDGNLTNGPTWTTGKIGGALSFDGVDDFVEVSSRKWTLNNTFTVSLWYFNQKDPGAIGTPFSLSWGEGMDEILLYLIDSKIRFYIHKSGGNYATRFRSSLDSTWNNIVCSGSGGITESNVNIFLNGNSVSSNYSTSGTPSLLSDEQNRTLRIGRRNTADPYYNKGLIDDVRIYDRALSAEEVQALYNLGQ